MLPSRRSTVLGKRDERRHDADGKGGEGACEAETGLVEGGEGQSQRWYGQS